MLLLSSSGSCLNLLGMLLGDKGVLLLLVLLLVLGVRLGLVVLWLGLVLLVLQPGRISLRVLVLVREDVLALRLKHGVRR